MPTAGRLRHRRTPERVLGDEVIVARPRDGMPVVFEPTAALVWKLLDDWSTTDDIDHRLADRFPEVSQEERVAARVEVLTMLRDEDLVERR
jgi:hypothetical protein